MYFFVLFNDFVGFLNILRNSSGNSSYISDYLALFYKSILRFGLFYTFFDALSFVTQREILMTEERKKEKHSRARRTIRTVQVSFFNAVYIDMHLFLFHSLSIIYLD